MKLIFINVLIQLAPGTTKTAAEAISRIKGVKIAHAVAGPIRRDSFCGSSGPYVTIGFHSCEDSEHRGNPEYTDSYSRDARRAKAQSVSQSKEQVSFSLKTRTRPRTY